MSAPRGPLAIAASDRATRTFLGLAVVLTLTLIVMLSVMALLMGEREAQGTASSVAGIRPIKVIEGPGVGEHPLFDRPMGVAVGPDDRIYVSDTGNDRICVFSKSGKFLFEFGGRGIDKPLPGAARTWAPGRLNYPVGIDVDRDGDVYVADFRNDRIHVFNANGSYLQSFPDNRTPVGKGSSGQDGGGMAVTDVTVGDEFVYATDRYQVFTFTKQGELVSQHGRPGRGDGEMDHPNGIALDSGGRLYLSDSNNGRIECFTGDWSRLWSVGATPAGPEARREQLGAPQLPRGLTVLEDGTTVATDAFSFGVVTISADGTDVDSYGIRGATPGTFDFPNDVDTLDDMLVVADKGNNRVQLVKLAK